MTTQAINLQGRISDGPIRIVLADKTAYFEHDADEVRRMIKAQIVEGVGPSSGRIIFLRVIYANDEAVRRLSELPVDRPPEESPGSITSGASREVYRETLGDSGCWCWDFKKNRNAFA